jgi:ATP-dependent DNA helicase RecG
LIRAEPGLRVPALKGRLGVSPTTVERALKELRDSRRVVFRGASKTGGYYSTSPS